MTTNGEGVSFRGDKNVLQLDKGEGYTIMQVY